MKRRKTVPFKLCASLYARTSVDGTRQDKGWYLEVRNGSYNHLANDHLIADLIVR